MKKKIAFISTLAMILCISSCAKSVEKPTDLTRNFTCDAVITQDETEYVLTLERVDGAGWNAIFSAPETIEGMEVSILNDQCTVNFKELTYTANREELPKNNMIVMVSGAVDKCIGAKKVTSTKKGDKIVETGTIQGTDFTAVVKGESVNSVEISNEIKAELSNFQEK